MHYWWKQTTCLCLTLQGWEVHEDPRGDLKTEVSSMHYRPVTVDSASILSCTKDFNSLKLACFCPCSCNPFSTYDLKHTPDHFTLRLEIFKWLPFILQEKYTFSPWLPRIQNKGQQIMASWLNLAHHLSLSIEDKHSHTLLEHSHICSFTYCLWLLL